MEIRPLASSAALRPRWPRGAAIRAGLAGGKRQWHPWHFLTHLTPQEHDKGVHIHAQLVQELANLLPESEEASRYAEFLASLKKLTSILCALLTRRSQPALTTQ